MSSKSKMCKPILYLALMRIQEGFVNVVSFSGMNPSLSSEEKSLLATPESVSSGEISFVVSAEVSSVEMF